MKRPGPVLGVPHVTCGTSGPAVALGWWFAWWVAWAQPKNRRKNHQWLTWRGWYSEYLKMIYSTSFCETKHCCVKILKPNIVMSHLRLTIPGIEYSVYKNQYVAPGNMIGLEYPPDKQQTHPTWDAKLVIFSRNIILQTQISRYMGWISGFGKHRWTCPIICISMSMYLVLHIQ
jgi:hypothetical protein